ncbi:MULTISPECIES: H-NS family nucleoid-associated regulatory protein [Paraburkholderia]|uniref:DNA-binding protein H-NS n=1 Tax=Paraburkholderia tuberum TaxID=157910 RepID=A0A1H1KII7_9BURK|nr:MULTISPECIES: H-NS family nucleoid-associated regulatory protein [Paraburkholderia]MBB5501245.1 DNA-binding protein H-NS [Paraburkholderia sp. MM5384-R2]SDR61877.1 DNA-binding protein H-NS [Paraburkholderia tuberum]
MATLESIQEEIAKLQAQAAAVATKDSAKVIAKIRGLMDQHALTIADIEASVGKRRGRKPGVNSPAKREASAAKYADPKTGATWTGHGRAPAWLANAKDRNKFLITGTAAKSASTAQKAPNAGKSVRAPQTPMYQDPKTGATWSGRGRAPAWIASAKDRTKFLIATTSKPAGAPKASTGKAVLSSKTAAKKAIGRKTTATKPAARKVSAKKAAAPAQKSTPKSVGKARPPVSRKPLAAKSTVKSAAPVEAVAPQAAPEVAGTSAEA